MDVKINEPSHIYGILDILVGLKCIEWSSSLATGDLVLKARRVQSEKNDLNPVLVRLKELS